MSHLSLPRIHFQGDFCTNVPTANNDDVVEFVNVAKVLVDAQGKSDDELRAWLKATATEHGGDIRAGWNYYGDNSCTFQNAKVTRIELPDRVITSDTDDPLIGGDLLLDGALMVDLNPAGGLGTQIFCERFRIQKGEDRPLVGNSPTRLYSRWLTFQRNMGLGRTFTAAAATWQTVIRGDQLAFGAPSSPALEALRTASGAPNGLVVRFCTYLVAPGIDSGELAQRFANGEEVENPAFGRVLGTMGAWQTEELTSVTLGRLLHPFDAATGDHTQFHLVGPAVAQIDRDRHVVSLDLITAFPERDKTLEKLDVGPVSLRLHYEDKNRDDTFTLGPVPYDKAAYEATAGIIDVPYSQDVEQFLDEGQLVLVQDSSGKELLAETDLMIETDDRAIYLQEGETQQVHLRMVEKGQEPQKEATLNIMVIPQGSANSSDTQVVELPDNIGVGPDGNASLTVTAKQPGVCVIRFVPAGSHVSALNPTTDFFMNVRVLPADDYGHVPDEQLTFDFVYQEVLRYYHLVYPAMSPGRIDFSDEQEVRQNAIHITARIAKDKWSTSQYMPRTRELSDGKRKLLTRWCQQSQKAGSS